eukprot:TRINITY_DN23981_c0_g1_i2.p1 TRINITY_DN23981_c0_g1~~TRINITY_DN23981_c0_g1_i2.p1  ORF type:complete len:265 (-),score=50.12 TRINITY_DN23981_c0_g1_i2:83-877(-)
MISSYFFFFQAEDGIRDLVRSRGLGDVYKRQVKTDATHWVNSGWMMTIVAGWNLFLAVASIMMLVGMAMPMIRLAMESGPVAALCDRDGAFGSEDGTKTTQAMFWVTMFVYSKYAELIDTVLISVRRKPMIFLHWFHHWTVLATTWAYVETRFVPGIWFGIINASVHTLMYHFYYRAACKATLTYPKLITTIQIVQMIGGIAITTAWSYLHFTDSKSCPAPNHPQRILMATYAMYGSYLVLFGAFYVDRYLRKGEAKKEPKKLN